MENATDALIMAGQILIFIVALTVCISSFTTVRTGIDNMISQKEIINLAKDPSSSAYINFMESNENGAVRVVGAETVISSIMRFRKEGFEVYFKFNNNAIYTRMSDKPGVIIKNAAQEVRLNGVNNPIIRQNDQIMTLDYSGSFEISELFKGGFFKEIKDLEFCEYLGEYQDKTDGGVSAENKLTKRIITYIQK